MSEYIFKDIFIEAVAAAVPKSKVSTINFSDFFTDTEKLSVQKNTGIIERRVLSNDFTNIDLGWKAVCKVVEGIPLDEIKAIIYVSQTHDNVMPFSSSRIHHMLGLDIDCLTIDINGACSSFISSLVTAFSVLQSQKSGKVLLVFAEVMTRIVSPRDKRSAMLFGDASSAILVSRSKTALVSNAKMYSDGSNSGAITIPASGLSRVGKCDDSCDQQLKEDGSYRSEENLYMDALGVFNFTMNRIPVLVKEFNVENNPINSTVYCFHQANKFILDRFRKKLKLNDAQIPINIDKYANTSGVSIPLLIVTELIKSSDLSDVRFIGFGAGLSWGIFKTSLVETKIHNLIEF